MKPLQNQGLPTFAKRSCDSPAGIERGALLAMRFADEAIVVANPEVSSVHDADRIIGLLDATTLQSELYGRMDKRLLLTRVASARFQRSNALSVQDVQDILSLPLLGVVPDSEEVLRASNLGVPVTVGNRFGQASQAYRDAAMRLMGAEVVVTPAPRAKGLFGRSLFRPAA